MKLATIFVLSTLLAGCATTTPPTELVEARTDFQKASTGPAATVAIVDVHDARVALDAAEKSLADEGDTPRTRDLAYIASRRAITAEARGDTLQTLAAKRSAEADLQQFKDRQLAETKGALAKAQRDTEAERRAREAADAKARDALAAIAGLQTRTSDRGLVLTLSGSVLFASGKSDLLPAAQARLAEVAKALSADKRAVTIIGYTDSNGSDELNTKLSQERAAAVRTYLVSQGIESSRVKAEGMGKANPIADNATPEGRANNRRVEIVLENGAPQNGPAGN